MSPISRNAPCPCGSGKKYKQCCLKHQGPAPVARPTKPRSDPVQRVREALAAQRAGRIDQAEAIFRHTIEIAPRHADARFGLGRLLGGRGRLPEAIEQVRQAVALDAKRSVFHSYLAQLLLDTTAWGEGLDAARRAIRLDPKSVRAHAVAAACAERLGRLDKAVDLAERAVSLAPDDVRARVTLGRILRRQGDLNGARRHLETAAAGTEEPALRARAWHELGFVLDRQGDSDAAFDAFTRAGEDDLASPHARGIDSTSWFTVIEQYRRGLTRDLIERVATAAPPAEHRLAFLVGFPRSGTTMTEQILAAHPGIVTTDERGLVRTLKLALGRRADDTSDIVAMIESLDAADIAALREAYWTEAREQAVAPAPDQLLVDKLPLNIVHAALLNVVFPSAPLIVALRDPRDVCLSCFMQDFNLNDAMINFVTMERTVAFYEAVMGGWRSTRDQLTAPWQTFRYEDTVEDLAGQARRLLGFLDIAWDDRVLRFHEAARAKGISTPSYEAVTERVHTRACGRWRRYEPQLRPMLPRLQPFVEAFGYGST